MLISIVYFVVLADNKNACTVDEGVALKTSACVVLLVVSLVSGASLADVLDDLKAGKAFADSADEMLVDTAGVDSLALHPVSIVSIALGAFITKTVDVEVAGLAITEESLLVEDLILSAAIA